jgi:hypothetical protein
MPYAERDRGVPTFLLLIALAAACSGQAARGNLDAGHATVATSKGDPRDRLLELAEAWFSTPATVSYRTSGPVPGQPTTAHLCLRQMFDDDYGEDRTTLLRRCSRQGTLRLVWDPPDVWQMDVTTPVDRFTLASTHDRTRICRSGDPHACRGIPTAAAIVKAGADFFFQRPREILAAIGATGVKTTPSPTEYDELPVECFAATGRDEHAEWCYSMDGLLLTFLRGSATEGWTSIEATSISRPGAD